MEEVVCAYSIFVNILKKMYVTYWKVKKTGEKHRDTNLTSFAYALHSNQMADSLP
jgi:hypothetical protein